MGNIWIPGGGGAGSGSDECTATRAEVLKGYGAITKDSDDEVVEGTLELTGTATDSQVLNGQTYYNADAKTKRTGSMANRGAISANLNAGESYTVPTGFHNGSGKVTANSLASQTSATASAGHILSGQTAWANGSKITGNIASMGGQTINPGSSQQTVSCSGKYMTGNIIINSVRTYASASQTVISSTGKRTFNGLNSGIDPNLSAYYVTISNIGFTPLFVSLVGEYKDGTPLHVAVDAWGLSYNLRSGINTFGANVYWLKAENISSSAIILPAGDYVGGRSFLFQAFGYY
ncbi:MAG: hypothetical protein LBQ71_12415 [Hungatella sp.]|jgi:hypothetical protein|nr:hypothetical protein [Hungatella sp.]